MLKSGSGSCGLLAKDSEAFRQLWVFRAEGFDNYVLHDCHLWFTRSKLIPKHLSYRPTRFKSHDISFRRFRVYRNATHIVIRDVIRIVTHVKPVFFVLYNLLNKQQFAAEITERK
jgi:hypothetical protein